MENKTTRDDCDIYLDLLFDIDLNNANDIEKLRYTKIKSTSFQKERFDDCVTVKMDVKGKLIKLMYNIFSFTVIFILANGYVFRIHRNKELMSIYNTRTDRANEYLKYRYIEIKRLITFSEEVIMDGETRFSDFMISHMAKSARPSEIDALLS